MIVRRAFAGGIIVLVSCLGFAASGDAQSGPTQSIVQLQTTVQAVDCDGQQVTLVGPGASSVVQSTLGSVIRVNGADTPLCGLAPFVGAPATAWVMARGGQIVLVRLEVASTPVPAYPPVTPPIAPAAAPPYPPAAPVPIYTPAPSPAAVVLGTVLVGGLVYLLIRAADGTLYRYPYAAPYAGAYQRPVYRPYVGPYARVPAYTYGPYRRCPNGTWGRWCR